MKVYAVEDFGGFVSSGVSYDTNVSAGIGEEYDGKGKLRDVGDITGDFAANIYLYPVKGFYLDYFVLLSYPFRNSEYSIFSHMLELAYQAELNSVDVGAGLEFGHSVADFINSSNRIEIEPYLELIHYRPWDSMGIYRASFSYRKPLDIYDYYYEGYKISASFGELFSFFNNKSSLYLDSTASLFLLENTVELFDPVMVDKNNSYLSLSQYLRLKFGAGMFDIIPGIRYEFSYFLESDRWLKFGDDHVKKRIDHLISPFIQVAFNVSDYFSIAVSYKYYKNISTIGEKVSDYYDYNYDRHKISLEIAAFF